jgi:hypothetical protein
LKPGKAFALLQQFVVNKSLIEFFYNTFKQLIAQENLSFGCPSRLMSPQKVKNQYSLDSRLRVNENKGSKFI